MRGRDVENIKPVLRTDEVAEERDLVGVYLHEISKTPLLDAAQEVDLAKRIEAGVFAEQIQQRVAHAAGGATEGEAKGAGHRRRTPVVDPYMLAGARRLTR